MLPQRRVHAVIPTADVDRLRGFYEGTLGFSPHGERPGAVMYSAGDGSVFVVSRSGGRSDGSFTQMAFTVPDVAAEVAELRARGVVFEEYETPKTDGGVARMPAGHAAWFRDPDGNLIGLIEFDEPL